jgi:ElaB/YqjD/DUF883 family membrane-anchored ribosome-binding protein
MRGTDMPTTKYTIPAGYDFAADIGDSTAHAFFAWLTHSQINPEMIDPKKDAVVTRNDDGDWSLTASTTALATGTWPLGLPTAPVIVWLEEKFGEKTAELDDVKSRLDRLADARKRASEAGDEAEELRAEILGVLSARKATIGTVGGVPFIKAKKVPKKGKFHRARFEAENPYLAVKYSDPDGESTRLEFI